MYLDVMIFWRPGDAKKANPACRESTTRLMELYQKALDETPAILENLYQCLYGTGTTLSSRFLRDYH